MTEPSATLTAEPSSTRPRCEAPIVYAFAGLLVLAWLVTAAANRHTLYQVDHVAGAWVAQSHWALNGDFYPPLASDGRFGGTRFGPLAIGLQAGAHALLGDPIVGPKALHALYLVALCSGLWLVLGAMQLPRHVRLLLAVLPLATTIGWQAGLSIRHDALPAALQVWALVALTRPSGYAPRLVVAAALLSALAFLSKASAGWGFAAGALILLQGSPRRLLIFVPCWGIAVGLGLGLVEWLSGGGFSENMRACLFPPGAGAEPMSVGRAVEIAEKIAKRLIVEPVLIVLLMMSVLGVWHGRKRLPQVGIAFVVVALMSLYLMSKLGIDSNHLIDLVAVSVLGAGLWLSCERSVEQARNGLPAFGAAVLVVAGASMAVVPASHYGPWGDRARVVAGAAAGLVGAAPLYSAEQEVRRQLSPDESMVSHYPMVPVLLGRDPIVADSWMLRYTFAEHADVEAAFIARIEAQSFDAFVFGRNVGPGLDFDDWHFGASVLDAVREHYELSDVGAFAVFRPKARDEAPASGASE
ncbi:MAG: hypothetical protein ACPGYV_06060 [Phycisphaeraceae bacterium]